MLFSKLPEIFLVTISAINYNITLSFSGANPEGGKGVS
jgi:hypothetical protein